MLLTEQIQIKHSKELSKLCHQCKNLYNLGNYYINKNYEILEEYLDWYDIIWILKKTMLFKNLPSQVAQNVLKQLHLNWKSFFQSIKDWKINPKKYKRIPRQPKYLKYEGEFLACFNYQHTKIKNGKIHFPKKTNLKPITVVTTQDISRKIRIVPKFDKYNLEMVHEKELIDLELDESKIISIDIGVNNLACVVNNIGLRPFIINGKPLKSINHYYNKKKAKITSILKKENNKYQSKKLQKMERIRFNKIKDYMHKASRYIVDYCVENNIGTIVIGYNPLWKQNVNIGKKNNQKFVQIPFNMLINNLEYKSKLIGINTKTITEEYTSLCSFLDGEEIKKHDKYVGKRINRGLFRTSNGTLINADVNGAFNIMKKAFPEAIEADGIQGAQLHPIRVNLNTKSKLMPIKTSYNTIKMGAE